MNLSDYKEMENGGSEGVVFLLSETTGHQIVLKRTSIERGLREIKAYKKLPHSGLLGYRMENNGVLLMISRHPGESLLHWAKSPDKQQRARLSQNLSKVLESSLIALTCVHDVGLCHGHLTPEKLIVSEDFRVHLVGFGESRTVEERLKIQAYDAFYAPEIVFSNNANLFLADYYSLGKCFQFVLDDQVSDLVVIEKIARLTSIVPEQRKCFLMN